jgi:hypothetical protein
MRSRGNPTTHSARIRPPVPIKPTTDFRFKPTTLEGPINAVTSWGAFALAAAALSRRPASRLGWARDHQSNVEGVDSHEDIEGGA